VKRLDLVRRLEQAGCFLLRHGGRHDIYHNPQTGRSEPVPRHRESTKFWLAGSSGAWVQMRRPDGGEQSD